ncbi:MAG: hypothetical protein RMJ19_02565 [Gemmatales bacterium]|nr:hypothetical protein [Gemmatales bacterium]MDW8174531.1 hypothetical protein [Gemmatales bacterium]
MSESTPLAEKILNIIDRALQDIKDHIQSNVSNATADDFEAYAKVLRFLEQARSVSAPSQAHIDKLTPQFFRNPGGDLIVRVPSRKRPGKFLRHRVSVEALTKLLDMLENRKNSGSKEFGRHDIWDDLQKLDRWDNARYYAVLTWLQQIGAIRRSGRNKYTIADNFYVHDILQRLNSLKSLAE